MIIEIALGIVVAVLLLATLPFWLEILWFLLKWGFVLVIGVVVALVVFGN